MESNHCLSSELPHPFTLFIQVPDHAGLYRSSAADRDHGIRRHLTRKFNVEDEETNTGTSLWSWARLLKRVFALDMGRCPFCQQGALRIIAAITQGEVIRKLLCHLKLAADPPPIAPARVRQEAFAWSST